ncbi:phage recombination protein Bet [Rhizobium leguminosarum bv. trifolii WSM2304]|uniref:Phage recombination protein Bet n=1 Tax=Rhizobium leguminosarum bv. trifolii (strain WSM2304) TaxID=395492 RepID=A0ABF7QP61_RHILW|nr:phage recombination protein Bet [Rhizobium leguminosarum]ACI55739.1 phage recombination protein Bet [Rhizobium leguminosarum bv. trifolii WSM2304]
MNAMTRYDMTPKQISLVKTTIAKDCNDEEFNLFCEVARAKGLDPFLGQIIPMVFSKGDAEKRKMTIIITRDGQRVIAQRCGDYRPASKPTQFEVDKAMMAPTNPLGIVSATVYLWKRDPKTGEWFEVVGQAYWDEFAPIKRKAAGGYKWEDTGEVWPDSGKPKRKKVAVGEETEVLDDSGNWCRMPRLMIEKCAQMQALRAGWPEEFTGTYDEAEMDRAKVLDLTASEIAAQEQQDNRLRAIGGKDALTIWWSEGFGLENVPDGKFFDRVIDHIANLDATAVAKWEDANRASLQIYWARHPGDALELKKRIEAARQKRAANVDKALQQHPLMAG